MICSHCKKPVSADAGPRAAVMHEGCNRTAHEAAVRRLGLGPRAGPAPEPEPTLYRVVGVYADGGRKVIGSSLGIASAAVRAAQGESGQTYARHRFERVIVEEDVR